VSVRRIDYRRPVKWLLVAAGLALLVFTGSVVYQSVLGNSSKLSAPCEATANGVTYGFNLAQAQNATTIAAVGKRMGLADHAVTIALATALQESDLRKLSYGDLDSVGLFQQSPSEGWGTATQLQSPRYAASAFYTHLSKVPGWESMSVTDAAQAVQHSAAPDAYEKWNSQSRVLAQALTGEVEAGFYCHVPLKGVPTSTSAALSSAMTAELGAPGLNTAVSEPRGWLVASWLIGHASEYHISSVSFHGRQWSASSGRWISVLPLSSDAVTIKT
jgi:hypothetical protein